MPLQLLTTRDRCLQMCLGQVKGGETDKLRGWRSNTKKGTPTNPDIRLHSHQIDARFDADCNDQKIEQV